MTIDAEALDLAVTAYLNAPADHDMVCQDMNMQERATTAAKMRPAIEAYLESREPEGSLEDVPGRLLPHVLRALRVLRSAYDVQVIRDIIGETAGAGRTAVDELITELSAQSSNKREARHSIPPFDGAGIPESQGELQRILAAAHLLSSSGNRVDIYCAGAVDASRLVDLLDALSPPSQESRKAEAKP